MGRGRGKGRKLTANHEDIGSGQQGEKIPGQKRRGRPQKPKKDEIDEEEVEKLEEDDENQNISTGLSSIEMCTTAAAKDGKKRKGNSRVNEKPSLMKDENGVRTESSTDDSTKSNGFRHTWSRRKSKPRRAAEVGVRVQVISVRSVPGLFPFYTPQRLL
ncbi:hypothetical protein Nepgr_009419 [Nepenthes gracilis]|uniref:Uncharacterized protein n=1 Tax=Nepenthes gracilis TaxID=150966 RepID=A0AAD3SB90_NEPGR|nr:hypothetical protein Nepgr_009419 [Nepenthes gracilis]